MVYLDDGKDLHFNYNNITYQTQYTHSELHSVLHIITQRSRIGWKQETVHIKINRRRRNQIWHQWFGLGSLSPHSGAGSGFRIRLGLGFRMDTWSRSMGAFYWERIPTPGSGHITPSKRKHYSKIF